MTYLILLANLCIFLVPAAAVAVGATRFARASRGEWKLLAYVPVIPLAYWGVRIARDVAADKTSHNLWPFELIPYGAVTALLVVLFLIGRRLAGGALPHDSHDSPRHPG